MKQPDDPAAPAQSATSASINPPVLKENEFRASKLPAGSALLVGEATVFNVGGTFCATQDKCTHRQGPLSKGKLDGSTVTCPLHGSQFNVCTGEVLRGPATNQSFLSSNFPYSFCTARMTRRRTRAAASSFTIPPAQQTKL